MDRDAVLKILRDAEPALRSQGISHAALFGSVARGDAGADSDIDIMVEIDGSAAARMGVFQYVGIVHMIEDMFPGRVDVSNRQALRSHVRPSAERDAVYAF